MSIENLNYIQIKNSLHLIHKFIFLINQIQLNFWKIILKLKETKFPLRN